MSATEIARDIELVAGGVKADAKRGDVDCALRHIDDLRSMVTALEDELRNGNLNESGQDSVSN